MHTGWRAKPRGRSVSACTRHRPRSCRVAQAARCVVRRGRPLRRSRRAAAAHAEVTRRFFLLLLCAACKKVPRTSYPGGREGLELLFRDVLEAARRDDRPRVRALLQSMVMSDEELVAV